MRIADEPVVARHAAPCLAARKKRICLTPENQRREGLAERSLTNASAVGCTHVCVAVTEFNSGEASPTESSPRVLSAPVYHRVTRTAAASHVHCRRGQPAPNT